MLHIEKFTIQFKTTEKRMIGHRTRFRKMTIYVCIWRGPAVKKFLIILNRVLITREIMRSRDEQRNNREEMNYSRITELRFVRFLFVNIMCTKIRKALHRCQVAHHDGGYLQFL